MQTEAPAAEYVPAPQLVQTGHAAGADRNLPAAQLMQTEAPAAEFVPAMQLVQAVAPEVGEYVPAEHKRVFSLRESCTCCV